MRVALGLALLGLIACPANAQVAEVSFGEPINTYVSELVIYQFGTVPYCDVRGGDRFLSQVERRLRRITKALVAREGQDAVVRAKKEAELQFQDAVGGFDLGACNIGDSKFDRQMYRGLQEAHLPNLKSLENMLGLTRGE